jgi:toxin HigB-1
MIQSFADQTTADLFAERSSRDARRIPQQLWRVVQRKLKLLDVAQALSDLASPPGNRLEALKGDQRGRYSIRVNDQYRLTFRWEGNHAYEVRCEDYHA